MAAETDKFVIASFALWAGDFSFFEQSLREFSNSFSISSTASRTRTPEDFIRASGTLRLRQLWHKRGEFRKLAAEYDDQNTQITDKPNILETKHLRATLWRTGDREFLMQGYLKDLSWQDELFARAHRLGGHRGRQKFKTSQVRSDMFDAESRGEAFEGLGAAWVVAANPFIQIELSDLGLLEATGVWTSQALPEQGHAITQPFLKVLENLDSLSAGK